MSFLTVAEIATLLRVNPLTVRRYIAEGKLPAVRAGRAVRVRSEAVDAFLTPVQPHANRGDGARLQRETARGRALSFDDPLWELVGSASDAPPSDAARKHEYLASVDLTDGRGSAASSARKARTMVSRR